MEVDGLLIVIALPIKASVKERGDLFFKFVFAEGGEPISCLHGMSIGIMYESISYVWHFSPLSNTVLNF